MKKWRVLWLALFLCLPACSNPTVPRLPEVDEEEDTTPNDPDDPTGGFLWDSSEELIFLV